MQQIGRYQVLGELGRGAMGVVYRAQDPAIGRTIAIKTIRLSDLTDPSERERLRERLFREAQSAGILSHPNIVTIYDILEENGMAYIFMELVNGPTLDRVLGAEQPPTREAILGILRQTASALDYAHRKGIVHRDIKPANIMVDDTGAAKITDFGVAKIASSQMTQTGMMMGTPSYMSPEQIQGGNVNGCADQFALGVIAYEILTGEKPFTAEYLPSLLYKIVREDPVPPQRLNPTLGAEVEIVLRRALAKDPAERFETCADFVREMEAACNARAGWVLLPRGSSQDMPTLGTTSAARIVSAPPAASPGTPPPVKPAAPTPTPPPLPPPPTPPVARPAAVSAPVPKHETHAVRNVLLAVAAVIVLAIVLVLAQRSTTAPPQQQATEVEKVPEPDTKPSPTAPAARAEDKPVVPPDTSGDKPAGTQPAKLGDGTTPARRTQEPLESEHVVQMITSPGGARIAVDGNPFCTAPCSLPLARGRHVMAVTLDGYREARKIFEVPQETNITVDLERITGALSVATTPPGATIILNGQARPETTPAVLKLPVGTYRLQVMKDNLRTDEETIQITDGGMSQRRYRLE